MNRPSSIWAQELRKRDASNSSGNQLLGFWGRLKRQSFTEQREKENRIELTRRYGREGHWVIWTVVPTKKNENALFFPENNSTRSTLNRELATYTPPHNRYAMSPLSLPNTVIPADHPIVPIRRLYSYGRPAAQRAHLEAGRMECRERWRSFYTCSFPHWDNWLRWCEICRRWYCNREWSRDQSRS